MIGIRDIASHVPARRVSNLDRSQDAGKDEGFIRDKIGFEPPQRRWLHDAGMRDRIAEILLDRRARERGLYDLARVEADHRRGQWQDQHGIWRVLSVELWLRRLESSNGRPNR